MPQMLASLEMPEVRKIHTVTTMMRITTSLEASQGK